MNANSRFGRSIGQRMLGTLGLVLLISFIGSGISWWPVPLLR